MRLFFSATPEIQAVINYKKEFQSANAPLLLCDQGVIAATQRCVVSFNRLMRLFFSATSDILTFQTCRREFQSANAPLLLCDFSKSRRCLVKARLCFNRLMRLFFSATHYDYSQTCH